MNIIQQISGILSDKTVFEFLDNEARVQIAKDIEIKTGISTTAEKVKQILIASESPDLESRYMKYLAAGAIEVAKMKK
tara:strand:- start:2315 stop:2548 length:234 start_codon:yes stop_codon:yes gene_type:complete